MDPPQTHTNAQAIQYEPTSLGHEPNKKVKVKLFRMLHSTPLKILSSNSSRLKHTENKDNEKAQQMYATKRLMPHKLKLLANT